MIKVLEKTLGILELVAVSSPRPLPPGRIAEKLELNRPTCSRILRDLCDAGYLRQISRMEGYTLGPRARSFADQVDYHEAFLEKARPKLELLARNLSQSVLLAERLDSSRYILYHRNCNSSLNIELNQLSWNDLFNTATGMILLSACPPETQEELYQQYRKNNWEIFEDLDSCEKALNRLAKTGEEALFIREKYQTLQWIAAVPVFRNGKISAALGVSAPHTEITQTGAEIIVREMRRTADLLTTDLSRVRSIG